MVIGHTKKLVLCALFIATGVLLPYLTGHAFALPGTVLLPMHLPVLLCGLLCGARFGLLCGLSAPLLSSLLTGMPMPYPMLPVLAVQLMTIGFFCGLLQAKGKRSIYLTLLVSMSAGWVAYGLMFYSLLLASEGSLRALSVLAALTTGAPGMLIQLLFVPPIVEVLRKWQKHPESPSMQQEKQVLEEAIARIDAATASCVLIRQGEIIHQTKGFGIAPLLQLYQTKPQLLWQATVTDKIVGKAAAMILVLGGVQRVHALTISAAAREYLEAHNISVSFLRCVDVISNRKRDGICPIERSVLEISDPGEGLLRIQETLAALQATS